MTDINDKVDTVIKGLQCCSVECKLFECPYAHSGDNCIYVLHKDAIALIKEVTEDGTN